MHGYAWLCRAVPDCDWLCRAMPGYAMNAPSSDIRTGNYLVFGNGHCQVRLSGKVKPGDRLFVRLGRSPLCTRFTLHSRGIGFFGVVLTRYPRGTTDRTQHFSRHSNIRDSAIPRGYRVVTVLGSASRAFRFELHIRIPSDSLVRCNVTI